MGQDGVPQGEPSDAASALQGEGCDDDAGVGGPAVASLTDALQDLQLQGQVPDAAAHSAVVKVEEDAPLEGREADDDEEEEDDISGDENEDGAGSAAGGQLPGGGAKRIGRRQHHSEARPLADVDANVQDVRQAGFRSTGGTPGAAGVKGMSHTGAAAGEGWEGAEGVVGGRSGGRRRAAAPRR